MANTATNVSTGKPNISGGVYVAPISTASSNIPTDATTALNTAFKCLGYVTEDGIENSNDIKMSDIKKLLGEKIKSLRKSRGLSQMEFAEKLIYR